MLAQDYDIDTVVASLILHPEWVEGCNYLRPHLPPKYDILFEGGKSVAKLMNEFNFTRNELYIKCVNTYKDLENLCLEVFYKMWDAWEQEKGMNIATSVIPRELIAEIDAERQEKWIKGIKQNDALTNSIEKIEQLKKGETTWIRTGNKVIDELLALDNGEINTIAGESGMGKTRIMIQILLILIENNIEVLVNSMEIELDAFMIQVACMKYKLSVKKISRGKGDRREYDLISNFLKQIKEKNIINVVNVRKVSELHQYVLIHKPKVVFNDFINLFEGGGDTEKMGVIQYQMKAIATSSKVAFINIAQMNKATGQNAGKRPSIHNIQGAGATRQVSTTIVMLYYEGYYYKDEDGNPISNHLELIVAKDRYGGTGSEKVHFENGNLDITDWYNEYQVSLNHNENISNFQNTDIGDVPF